MKAIIAAAGTAGHINPGIAIANKIKEEEPSSEIIFIGTGRGLEKDLVSRAGYELKTIEAYGLDFKRPDHLLKTLKGFGDAKKIITKFQPDVVIGTGGYICGAVITIAHKLGIPTLLHESNAFPGKAVKMLLKRTDCIMVGFEDAINRLKPETKIVVTGNPTKIKDLHWNETQKSKKKAELGLDSKLPVLLIFGGSQGAKAINNAVLKVIKAKSNQTYQIVWASGPAQYEYIKKDLENEGLDIENLLHVKVYPYIYQMEEMMNIADLLMCRSGAMTVNEVSIIGKPAIFVPLPGVSQNHQEYNARALESRDAARIILNADLESTDLNAYVQSMINDSNKLLAMGKKAKELAHEDAIEKIYAEIKSALKKCNIETQKGK